MKRQNTHDPKKSHQAWGDAINLAFEGYENSKKVRNTNICLALKHFISCVHFFAISQTHSKYFELTREEEREVQRLYKSMDALEEDLFAKLGCEF
jgi:hypothetical protein